MKLHLSVFMDNSTGELATMLENPAYRTAAVDAIMAELTRPYEALGDNPYSGVTLDFEGLRSAQKDYYTQFITELESRLTAAGKTLYVAVMPATSRGGINWGISACSRVSRPLP